MCVLGVKPGELISIWGLIKTSELKTGIRDKRMKKTILSVKKRQWERMGHTKSYKIHLAEIQGLSVRYCYDNK